MTSDLLIRPNFNEPLVHEYGCATLAALPATAAKTDALIDITTKRDELIRYALDVRPCYDRINRIIGQLAGLFILAQARGRFDADFESTTAALRQIEEVRDAISSIVPPAAAKHHLRQLCLALAEVRSVSEQFGRSLPTPEKTRASISAWTATLKQASARVRASAAVQLGLMPVDLSHACCSCSASHPSANPESARTVPSF